MKANLGFGLAGIAIVVGTAVGVAQGDIEILQSRLSSQADDHGDAYRPLEQSFLNELAIRSGEKEAFKVAFEAGDELTELAFNASQGVGAKVGEGKRFSRFPRADLKGDGEWTTHLPKREGGPNATSCIACHNSPGPNGAGDVALNAVVDPAHTGNPRLFLERNTLPLLALGVPQRLAEEMSIELATQRTRLFRQACAEGQASGPLKSKGVSFGSISATRQSQTPCEVTVDWGKLEGIDKDLVVKAFGWKGNHSTIRAFTRNAAHNELGLQAVELVGEADADHDGVPNELSVGDLTALTVYMAALERPVTRLELAALGLEKVTSRQRGKILKGESLFESTGCATCHVPRMKLDSAVFREPSVTPGFYDRRFPSGDDPADHRFASKSAIKFDLTDDQPNNQIRLEGGAIEKLGALSKTPDGGAMAHWFTDFKRHDMGPDLADPSDPLGIGARMWLTRSLAGVGSTGPWLHDGRATTLDEAILAHDGDAQMSRKNSTLLEQPQRQELLAFLENLVIFKQQEAE